MKKVLLVLLAFSVLALPACGGSSGGGGGGGPEVITSTPSTDSVYLALSAPAGDVFSYMVADGETIAALDDGGYAKKTAEGIEVYTVIDIEDIKFAKKMLFSEFKDDPTQNYYLSSLESQKTVNQKIDGVTVTGSMDMTDTLYVLGEKLGLEFSDFGGWAMVADTSMNFSYDGRNIPISFKLGDMEGVWLGDAAKKQSFTVDAGAVAPLDFTGTAIGMAYAFYLNENTLSVTSNHKLVTGTATMSVNLTDLSKASLLLDFDNFYKFTINNINVAGGAIAKTASTSVSAVINSNTTGVTLNVNYLTADDLSGQFYGNGSPTEAVGAFEIEDNYYFGDRGVSGAFGVKQ